MSDILTIKQVAERLKVSERTIRNWIDKGDLKAYRFGLQYRIDETDLQTFIQNSKVKGDN